MGRVQLLLILQTAALVGMSLSAHVTEGKAHRSILRVPGHINRHSISKRQRSQQSHESALGKVQWRDHGQNQNSDFSKTLNSIAAKAAVADTTTDLSQLAAANILFYVKYLAEIDSLFWESAFIANTCARAMHRRYESFLRNRECQIITGT